MVTDNLKQLPGTLKVLYRHLQRDKDMSRRNRERKEEKRVRNENRKIESDRKMIFGS